MPRLIDLSYTRGRVLSATRRRFQGNTRLLEVLKRITDLPLSTVETVYVASPGKQKCLFVVVLVCTPSIELIELLLKLQGGGDIKQAYKGTVIPEYWPPRGLSLIHI